MLSQYADPQYALQVLEKGSRGRAYLLKERVSDLDQLLAAIHEVAHGDRPQGHRRPGGGPFAGDLAAAGPACA